MEQLNIEGKRSGDGFVCHKDRLVNALSRAIAERVNLFDADNSIGRRGFIGYLKALAGSNIVKVVPANSTGLKVVCGSHSSVIPYGAWLKDKTPFTFCQIRISPSYAIMPNIGSLELAEALNRVLPFTASGDDRPVLRCVKFTQKDSKLTFIGCDGFTLGELNLDFEAGEAEALIDRDNIKAIMPAIRKAKRVKLCFEQKPDKDNSGLLAKALVIDTELVKYSLPCVDGSFPDYNKVIPTEFIASANFDTKEAIKACQSLLAIWYDDKLKSNYRTLIMTVSEGKLTIEAKGDRGMVAIQAETSGEAKVAVTGNYLLRALKACGGIAEMKVKDAISPVTFSVDSYRCLAMPMNLPESQPEAKAEAVSEAQETEQAQAVKEAEAVVKKVAKEKAKAKHERKRKREPVAV